MEQNKACLINLVLIFQNTLQYIFKYTKSYSLQKSCSSWRNSLDYLSSTPIINYLNFNQKKRNNLSLITVFWDCFFTRSNVSKVIKVQEHHHVPSWKAASGSSEISTARSWCQWNKCSGKNCTLSTSSSVILLHQDQNMLLTEHFSDLNKIVVWLLSSCNKWDAQTKWLGGSR